VRRAVLLSLTAIGCGRFSFGEQPPIDGAPVDARSTCITQLASHGAHICALRGDGTVWCWGDNTYGNLGDQELDNSAIPKQVTGLHDIVTIASGENTACAVDRDGALWCWGADLGDGTQMTARTAPVQITGLPAIRAVSAGEWHTCATGVDDSVWCWGRNDYGPYGDGSTTSSAIPVLTPMPSGRAIAIGDDLKCILMPDRSVQCAGRGSSGERGDGTFDEFGPTLRPVVELANVQQIDAGCHRHACGVMADATVRCWGENLSAELGDGTNVNSSSPVVVSGLTGQRHVAVGAFDTCSLGLDGHVSCWGTNEHGNLGDGTTDSRGIAMPVLQIDDATELEAGCGFQCVVRSDHSVWCWGENASGGVGDGTFADRSIPVVVPSLGCTN
jgi:alpha-tubulin suppressor-like RCC1 family protein